MASLVTLTFIPALAWDCSHTIHFFAPPTPPSAGTSAWGVGLEGGGRDMQGEAMSALCFVTGWDNHPAGRRGGGGGEEGKTRDPKGGKGRGQ